MSSYDLLAGGTYSPDTLPEDMSGVLCRCTGYRGILAAVADVAETHPDGVPPPRAAVPPALVGRLGNVSGAASQTPSVRHATQTTEEIAVPTGTPTATVAVRSELASGVDDVWAVLADFDRLAACLPGAEMTADLGDDRYRGRATVGLGPVSLRFDGLAHVVEHDPSARRMRVLAQGTDRGGLEHPGRHPAGRGPGGGRRDGAVGRRRRAPVRPGRAVRPGARGRRRPGGCSSSSPRPSTRPPAPARRPPRGRARCGSPSAPCSHGSAVWFGAPGSAAGADDRQRRWTL